MYDVYRIRSRQHPERSFIGVSRDVKNRLHRHNDGLVEATREHRPWKLSFYAAFSKKERAVEFEEFLKSPAGKTFGRKHLWQKAKSEDEPAP